MDKVADPLSFVFAPKIDDVRDLIETIKYVGYFQLGAKYSAVKLALKVLSITMPSVEAKRVFHLEWSKAKVENRLDMKTDRNDFMTYVSFRPDCFPGHLPDTLNRYFITTKKVD